MSATLPPRAANVATLLSQGQQHQEHGRLEAAESLYRQVLRRSPAHPRATYQLAQVLLATGRLREAQRGLERLARSHPQEAGVHCALGQLYRRIGLETKAVFHLSRAAELVPDRLDVHLALISTCGETGRLTDAKRCADRAQRHFPDRFELPLQLGVACLAAGHVQDAAPLLETAAARAPDSALALYNLGRLADEQRDTGRALELYRRAHALDPSFEPAAFNLSDMQLRTGQVSEALARFEALAAGNPSDTTTLSACLMAAQYQPGVTARHLASLHRRWDRAASIQTTPPSPPRPRPARERLRVGLVSADLAEHPVGYFTIGAVEAFDPRRIEVVCYAGRATDDAISLRFKRAARAWRSTVGRSAAEVVAAVASDRIDILIDLAGHTRGNRLDVFARRAAPLQLSWAGYVGTTGLAAMDGLIADRFHVPPGEEACYVEQVIRLPDGYVCFDPPADAPPVTDLPAGDTAPLSFASFHHPPKINPTVVRLWSRVLHDQPGSTIRFIYAGYDVPEVQARIRGWFAACDIAAERLQFRGRRPRQELLRQYNAVDLALDPLPYAGGLTTCEALWMGVPVITLPGQSFAGRHACSHLSVAGCADMIARDPDDYVAIIRRLAADRTQLRATRLGLRQRVVASPLCDPSRFARNLEAALLAAWQRACPPAPTAPAAHSERRGR